MTIITFLTYLVLWRVTINGSKNKSGFIYILQHSLFDDVVKIGATTQSPELVAKSLSEEIKLPGEYSVFSAVACDDPSGIEAVIKTSIKPYQSVGNFYEVSPSMALNIIKRDTMRIPVVVNC